MNNAMWDNIIIDINIISPIILAFPYEYISLFMFFITLIIKHTVIEISIIYMDIINDISPLQYPK